MAARGYQRCMKGKYKPLFPKKYAGNVKNIVYRSQAEMIFMRKLDKNPAVISWASEEYAVRYYNPIKLRWARYYVDFVVKLKNKDGVEEVVMLELKPLDQTHPPLVTEGKNMQSYLHKMAEWTVNKSKWKAAVAWCNNHNMRFIIVARDDAHKFHELNEHQLQI